MSSASEHEPPADPGLDDSAITGLLAHALALHRQGQLDAAGTIYGRILQAEPSHADALHLAGLMAHQAGDPRQAVALIERAVAAQPGRAALHGNLAAALFACGRFEEALLHSDRSLALQSGQAQGHANRARALEALGRHVDALASYEAALRWRPADAELHHRCGLALRQLGRLSDAAMRQQQAIALDPLHGDAHFQLGEALRLAGRLQEALACYDAALALQPADAQAACHRGNVLQELGLHDRALASYELALSSAPGYVDAHHNRGAALRALGRLDEAQASYGHALALDPRHVPAHIDRGLVFQDLDRVDEAMACHDAALALRPGDAKASWNKAWLLLREGRLEEGWPLYEAGWPAGERGARREFTQPLWLGLEPLRGRTILLHAEQGLGDTLQFCRYAAQVAALGAKVLLEVPGPLVRLMRSLRGVDEVIEAGAALPRFDVHCPLMSLPLAFGTRLETIPCEVPYLGADVRTMARWARPAGALPGARRRIGIAWSGSHSARTPHRSLRLEQILPSLPSEFDYVVLHKDVREVDRDLLRAQPNFEVPGDAVADFADTAALCETVERVISVDTSVAHLAGALGKPTWVLLRFAADWRWLRGRDDSPWYPGMKLYRQHKPRDWGQVLERLAEDLSALGPRVESAQGCG